MISITVEETGDEFPLIRVRLDCLISIAPQVGFPPGWEKSDGQCAAGVMGRISRLTMKAIQERLRRLREEGAFEVVELSEDYN